MENKDKYINSDLYVNKVKIFGFKKAAGAGECCY